MKRAITRLRMKLLIGGLFLIPLLYLLMAFYEDNLGANPLESVIRYLGHWALYILLLSLAISPFKRLTRSRSVLPFRRMIGLFAYFYATLHVFSYIWFDEWFDWFEIGRDILERPFITIGMLAFVLLSLLAVTSTNKAMKRLGKRWLQLHRLSYLIAIFVLIHFFWMVKLDTTQPLIDSFILSLLLGERLIRYYLKR